MAITPYLGRAYPKGNIPSQEVGIDVTLFSESNVAGALKGFKIGLPPELN